MSDFGFELPDDSEEEAPDWLEGIGDDAHSGQAPPPEDSQPAEGESPADDALIPPMDDHDDDEGPDWLQDIRSAESVDDDREEEPNRGDTPSEGDPDWLENIRQKEQTRQQELETSAIPEDKEDFETYPGGQDEYEDLSQPSPEESGDPSAQEASSPDWLSGLEDETTPEAAPSERAEFDAAPQSFDDLAADADLEDVPGEPPSGFVDTGSLPSWLVDIKRGGPPPEDTPPDEVPAFVSEDDQENILPPAEDIDLTPGDLPSWISESPPEEPPAEAQAETPDPEPEHPPDLARANLPNWLHAMRPVDIPKAPEEGLPGHEETLGPLAGLQNLIPAEPDIIQFGKSPTFSLKLDVTKTHERSTDILEQLISEESRDRKPRISVEAITQGAVRWVVATLLLLSIAVPIMLGSDGIELPASDSPGEGTSRTLELIHDLPPGGPVLVAFDYQPAFTGELYAASTAVFDHMLLRGAQLAIFSTHPTGASQGVNFLQHTLAEKHTYIADQLYVDLGYLAGGPAGLRTFAANPAGTMPQFFDIEGAEVSIWDWAPLDQVETVSDFAMVLVLTDSPEVARAWIEQVDPLLGDTPLVMVVSEQAEPFLIPYYRSEAGQVDALMAGIQDGAYYESNRDSEHQARAYWNSYSVALGISVAVIFLGSLVGAASMLIARFRRPAKEAKE
ncbi:MAG: hypothetical protein OEV06_04425 [Anaerolineae bacterium]|nr:hypothetical protein [Anaerolineae bacterium]